ncbi:class I SAM-dependent methyltransferase [Blastococcus sp. SYSU D01042]
MRASERLAWAAEVVAPRRTDRLLEVGCGHGVLLSLLAARVPDGEVVGVDRSATMTAAAGRRNADAVAGGRVRLHTARLTDADLGAAPFDVVVSFDVRAFWTPPAPEWDVVEGCCAPAAASSSPSL